MLFHLVLFSLPFGMNNSRTQTDIKLHIRLGRYYLQFSLYLVCVTEWDLLCLLKGI